MTRGQANDANVNVFYCESLEATTLPGNGNAHRQTPPGTAALSRLRLAAALYEYDEFSTSRRAVRYRRNLSACPDYRTRTVRLVLGHPKGSVGPGGAHSSTVLVAYLY